MLHEEGKPKNNIIIHTFWFFLFAELIKTVGIHVVIPPIFSYSSLHNLDIYNIAGQTFLCFIHWSHYLVLSVTAPRMLSSHYYLYICDQPDSASGLDLNNNGSPPYSWWTRCPKAPLVTKSKATQTYFLTDSTPFVRTPVYSCRPPTPPPFPSRSSLCPLSLHHGPFYPQHATHCT
jgi:hypothetical protein